MYTDRDGVIVLGDSPTPSNNITIKTPAVADGSLEIYQGVPGALGNKLMEFDPANTDFNSKTKAAVNASGAAPIYACRAWVNFDGTTTPPTIRASGNVSSVAKVGPGVFKVNFTSPMPDSSLAPNVTSALRSGVTAVIATSISAVTATEVEIAINAGGTYFDSPVVSVTIFR